jgi:hypothetical protein
MYLFLGVTDPITHLLHTAHPAHLPHTPEVYHIFDFAGRPTSLLELMGIIEPFPWDIDKEHLFRISWRFYMPSHSMLAMVNLVILEKVSMVS